MRLVVAAHLVLLLVGACSAPYQMSVRNVDAPAVTLIINGQAIADLPCGVGRVVVRPGENAPALPWRLEIHRANGEVFASIDVDGTRGPQHELVIRDIGAIEVPPADPADAAFAALPSCALRRSGRSPAHIGPGSGPPWLLAWTDDDAEWHRTSVVPEAR